MPAAIGILAPAEDRRPLDGSPNWRARAASASVRVTGFAMRWAHCFALDD